MAEDMLEAPAASILIRHGDGVGVFDTVATHVSPPFQVTKSGTFTVAFTLIAMTSCAEQFRFEMS
jgi:hypothetical protein